MKKIHTIALLLLIVLALCSCGTKKVESNNHYGYDLDYVKDNFNPSGFEIVINNDKAVRYEKGNTTITFSIIYDEKYIDAFYIVSDSKEEAITAIEKVNGVLDAYTDECTGVDFLEDASDLSSITSEDIKFGFIPDFEGDKFMFEVIKYK